MRVFDVVIVQRIIPNYRVQFFDLLFEECKSKGINIHVVYGQSNPGMVPIGVDYSRPWSVKVVNKYLNIFGVEFIWQPCLNVVISKDFCVVEQANRLSLSLLSPILKLFGCKFFFWGHGRNLQAEHSIMSLREKVKKKFIFFSDHFFAYTSGCKNYLISIGYPECRITDVNNSIDMTQLVAARILFENKLCKAGFSLKQYRERNTVIYCGGIYSHKNIEFLLAACKKVRLKLDDFRLIVVGDGPDAHIVRQFAQCNDWVEYVGAKFGIHIVEYFLRSKYLLLPSAVGLAILDSFALRTPIITTKANNHGPEFDYLSHSENGYVTDFNLDAYAEAVIRLLKDEKLHQVLVDGCLKSAEEYSVEQMAKRFAEGLLVACNGVNKGS